MKIAKLMCASAMTLALAACGSAGEEPQDKSADAAAVEAEAVPTPVAPAEAVDAAAETPAADGTADAPEAAPAAVPGATPAQAASFGPPDSFLVCSACHAVVPGKNGIGPSLAGIVGNKAASAPGFAYSDALKKANVTWTDAALDKWLEAPMKMVPGTRMMFGGIPDAAKRKELIAYMKTL